MLETYLFKFHILFSVLVFTMENQLQKVDDHLKIEFTEIKQEPLDHFENNYQSLSQNQNDIKPTCISCDDSFNDPNHSNGSVLIHGDCFKKLSEKLNMALEKNLELEIQNSTLKEELENIKSESEIKCNNLSTKLALTEKIIENTTEEKNRLVSNLIRTEGEFQKIVCENKVVASEVEELRKKTIKNSAFATEETRVDILQNFQKTILIEGRIPDFC